MREEADDGGGPLELGFELGDQGQGLGVGVVEIKDDESGAIGLFPACELGELFLFVFDEGDLDAELAGGLLDFGDEEEVIDKEEDPGGCVVRDGDDAALRVVDGLRVVGGMVAAGPTAAAPVAVLLDGGGRCVGEVAVDDAVAVVHGTDEAAGTAVALLAAPAAVAAAAVFAGLPAVNAIAELMRVLRTGVRGGAAAAAAAVSAGGKAAVAAAARGGLVAGVVVAARPIAVAVAELLFPPLNDRTAVGLVPAARRCCLEGVLIPAGVSRRGGGGLEAGDGAGGRSLLGLRRLGGGIAALAFALAAPASTAFGLPHAVRDGASGGAILPLAEGAAFAAGLDLLTVGRGCAGAVWRPIWGAV